MFAFNKTVRTVVALYPHIMFLCSHHLYNFIVLLFGGNVFDIWLHNNLIFHSVFSCLNNSIDFSVKNNSMLMSLSIIYCYVSWSLTGVFKLLNSMLHCCRPKLKITVALPLFNIKQSHVFLCFKKYAQLLHKTFTEFYHEFNLFKLCHVT